MWFNLAFRGYNKRKVEMAGACSTDDRMAKIVLAGEPSRANKKRAVHVWGERRPKEKI